MTLFHLMSAWYSTVVYLKPSRLEDQIMVHCSSHLKPVVWFHAHGFFMLISIEAKAQDIASFAALGKPCEIQQSPERRFNFFLSILHILSFEWLYFPPKNGCTKSAELRLGLKSGAFAFSSWFLQPHLHLDKLHQLNPSLNGTNGACP